MQRKNICTKVIAGIAILDVMLVCTPSLMLSARLSGLSYDSKGFNYVDCTDVTMSAIKASMPSNLRDAILIGIVTTVPAILDTLADCFWNINGNAIVLFLLAGVNLPHIVILFQSYSPNLLVVLHHVRAIILFGACLALVSRLGDNEIFNSWKFVIASLLSYASMAISSWISFTTHNLNDYLPAFYLCYVFSLGLFGYVILLWISKKIYNSPDNACCDNMIAGAVLVSYLVIAVIFLVLYILYGPFITRHTDPNIFIFSAYVETVFTVSVWFIHNYTFKRELYRSKVI